MEQIFTANMIAMIETFFWGVGVILLFALALGMLFLFMWLMFKLFDSYSQIRCDNNGNINILISTLDFIVDSFICLYIRLYCWEKS